MSVTKQKVNVVIGEINFAATVSAEIVEALANELLEGKDGSQYSAMYIRPKESPRLILGFSYEIGTDFERDYKKYYHKITDILKRRFGNDCGWSISGPVLKLK